MNEMIILRERVITISPGDTFDQSLQGNVLRVTAGRVPLRIQDRNQQMDFSLLAGERAEFPGEFPGLILSHGSGVDETFTIQVGKGVNVASALVSGTVAINGEVKTSDEKDYEGAITYNAPAGAVAAAAMTQLIDPAVNVNGVIVLGFEMLVTYATPYSPLCLILSKTAAETLSQGQVLHVDQRVIGAANGAPNTYAITTKRKIPAGKGVYFSDIVAQATSYKSITYKVL